MVKRTVEKFVFRIKAFLTGGWRAAGLGATWRARRGGGHLVNHLWHSYLGCCCHRCCLQLAPLWVQCPRCAEGCPHAHLPMQRRAA